MSPANDKGARPFRPTKSACQSVTLVERLVQSPGAAQHHVRVRQLIACACCVLVMAACLALVGCKQEEVVPPVETSDEMWDDTVLNDEFYVFQYGEKTFTVKDPVTVKVAGTMPLEDGKFYKVTADVTYLNGGVAGYVNYPEIGSVSNCEEVSPLDIGLPSIEDGYYGVTLVGDYADGDVFVLEAGVEALWKDGEWLYRYDDMVELDHGVYACCLTGVTPREILDGMKSGVLACEEYFVLPARPAE